MLSINAFAIDYLIRKLASLTGWEEDKFLNSLSTTTDGDFYCEISPGLTVILQDFPVIHGVLSLEMQTEDLIPNILEAILKFEDEDFMISPIQLEGSTLMAGLTWDYSLKMEPDDPTEPDEPVDPPNPIPDTEVVIIDEVWWNDPANYVRVDGPRYYDRAGTTARLAMNLDTKGTALFIIADDVHLDKNGHTIKYDNWDIPKIENPSFELDTGWDFSNTTVAPNTSGFSYHRGTGNAVAKREVFDGNRSLKIDPSKGDGYIESEQTLDLPANCSLSLQGKVYNPDSTDSTVYIQLVTNSNKVWAEVATTGKNYHGLEHREVAFHTQDAISVKVRVGIRNAQPGRTIFVDDLHLGTFRHFGVFLGPQEWAMDKNPDAERFGFAERFYLSGNGVIEQGQAKGTECHAISGLRGKDHIFNGFTSVTSGIKCCNVALRGLGDCIVENFRVTTYGETTENRNQFIYEPIVGPLVARYGTVTGGSHCGIVMKNAENRIHDVTISIRSRYTNGFAVLQAFHAHDIIVDNLGKLPNGKDCGGRGISPIGGTLAKKSRIYNCSIKTRELLLNMEYQGQILGGCYGIQIEKISNVQVHHNYVEVIAQNGSWATAMRVGGSGGGSTGIEIWSNVFKSISDGFYEDRRNASYARIYRFTHGIEFGDILLQNNEEITNDGYFWTERGCNQINLNPRISKLDSVLPVSYPWEGGYSSGDGPHSDIRIVDPLGDVGYLDSAFGAERYFNSNPDVRYSASVDWKLLVKVITYEDGREVNVQDASCQVLDQNGNVVAQGVTSQFGEFIEILREFRWIGGQRDDFQYTVNCEGQIVDAPLREKVLVEL